MRLTANSGGGNTFNALDVSRAKASKGPLVLGARNACGTDGPLNVDNGGAGRRATLAGRHPFRGRHGER